MEWGSPRSRNKLAKYNIRYKEMRGDSLDNKLKPEKL